MTAQPWYADGLRFACTQCGNCCTGPPGYVWCSEAEAKAIARALGIGVQDFLDRDTRLLDGRRSLCEEKTPYGYDCVFLRRDATGKAGCAVYAVRPAQCRTWPFWPENLAGADGWRQAARRCPGIAAGIAWRGTLYTVPQIRIIRDG